MSDFSSTRPVEGDSAVWTSDPMGDFCVTEPAQVLALLKALQDRHVVLNLSGSDGSALSTSVWALDAAQQRLWLSADLLVPALPRLIEAEEATAVGYLDQVKLQFDVQGLMLLHSSRGSTLQAHWPQRLYRFQRRSAYRVRVLAQEGPVAQFRHPDIPDMRLELRLLDLSAGGCALLLPHDVPPVPPGVDIHGAAICLDAQHRVPVHLRVHHVTAIQPGSGGARLGCELQGLSPEAERQLARYVDQLQKRRRMLALE